MAIYTNKNRQSTIVDVLHKSNIEGKDALFVRFPAGHTAWVWANQVEII